MQITIKTPCKAYLSDISNAELEILTKQLTFSRTDIAFLLQKHNANRWFKSGDPKGWNTRLKELQEQINQSLVFSDQEGFYIRPGSIPYIKKLNISQVTSEIKHPSFKPIEFENPLPYVPYDYQLNSVQELLRLGHGNIEVGTGLGKTTILLLLAKILGIQTVVVTPSKSIFNELLTFFKFHLGSNVVGGYGDGKKEINKLVTIAIGRSLSNLKPNTKEVVFFKKTQAICVDEAHTWGANELERVCHEIFETTPYRFFVSGTQTRGNGTKKLLQSIIGKNVLTMDVKEGIEGGYLSPLEFKVLPVISSCSSDIKDPNECKRVHFLYNDEVAQISAKIANASWLVNKQQTLILVQELHQISHIAKYLKIPYSYVFAGTDKDGRQWGLTTVKLQQQVDSFNEGKTHVLIGTKSIFTGTNIYPTHNTINWIGGKSEVEVKQGPIGRSTRLLHTSKYQDLHTPKNKCIIFDFDVTNVDLLRKQLEQRIKFYKETGGSILYL